MAGDRYLDHSLSAPIRKRTYTMNSQSCIDSRVIIDGLDEILLRYEMEQLKSLNLTSSHLEPDRAAKILPYDSTKVIAYAQRYCSGGNDCPDAQFPLDCTHFMCHCLAATDVAVTNPSASCQKGLCIRVNDLAAAFDNATSHFGNVKRISSHAETRRGDFCFIPTWFGLSKEHVMLLASTANSSGAPVYAHTNNRCGTTVPFEGAGCAYYRIEDAVGFSPNRPVSQIVSMDSCGCARQKILGRIYVTIEVRCPKCDCYLASFSEYRESSSSIYVGAIVTISYTGACYNKGYCGSGAFDWRGTATSGKIMQIDN
jgi:hypothetical protein